MDRLVRLRQREARRGGEQRAVTTLSCLPAELLGNVVEFACPYEVYGDLGILSNCSSWLSSLLHVGCTNSSFLEALKYISKLKIDIMDMRWPDELAAYQDMLPARCDAAVRRWCDIASRRLRHVRVVYVQEGRNTFNPVQTKLVVDCAASFPSVQDFDMNAGEAVSTCMSVAANLRAGRFSNLRRLEINCGGDMSILRRKHSSTFNARRIAKFAFDELIALLPPDLGIDCMVHALYPKLIEIGDEDTWDLWASTFFDCVAKGADVRSRSILRELEAMHEWPYDDVSQKRMDVYYRTVETLLTVHRVDPNARGRTCGRFISDRPVLWMMLDSVAGTVCRLEGDSDFDISPNEDDPAVLEPVFRFLMRTIDLLVRHGARSTLADLPGYEPDDLDVKLRRWILARPDCTQRMREAMHRGDMCF
jgi:hypothetical protein